MKDDFSRLYVVDGPVTVIDGPVTVTDGLVRAKKIC